MPQGPDHGEKSSAPLIIKQDYIIALGGNLTSCVGPPEITLGKAIEELENQQMLIRAISSFYHTPAFPKGTGPDYVNAVVDVGATIAPAQMLVQLNAIEEMFGRKRDGRWGGRTLDLDILACGAAVTPDTTTYQMWHDLPPDQQLRRAPTQLILPHPRLQDRAFVLVPMADVAPDWVHPVLGLTTLQMRDALPIEDVASVKRA